jgi:hypothetical protein
LILIQYNNPFTGPGKNTKNPVLLRHYVPEGKGCTPHWMIDSAIHFNDNRSEIIISPIFDCMRKP